MPPEDTFYSVSELSEIAGISVRTLHYYDQIDLLKAKRTSSNGYRVYSIHDAAFLQQILIYRNLDMSLDDIKTIMIDNSFDLLTALKKQKTLLIQRQSDTQLMIDNIEVTMCALKSERNIDIFFDNLPTEKAEHWKSILKNDAEIYARLSEQETIKETELANDWTLRYATTINEPVHSDVVQLLIKEAYIQSNRIFMSTNKNPARAELSYEIYLIMAEESKNGVVASEMYNHYQDGLASHVGAGMLYFAVHTLRKNQLKHMKLV